MDTPVIDLSAEWWHGAAADEPTTEREFAMRFVRPAERPTHDQVPALREAAERLSRPVWWRRLAVELAAYSGVRQSELLALRPCDIDLDHRRIRVDWQEHRGDRKRAKGRKRRVTMFPTVTPTGFPLPDALARRCGEIAPDSLLFGTASGRPFSSSNWHRDVFEKAALEAGREWAWHDRVTVAGAVRERKFALRWHGLRHTFATVALDEWHVPITQVALLCGHSSRQVTERLYISAAADVLDAVEVPIR